MFKKFANFFKNNIRFIFSFLLIFLITNLVYSTIAMKYESEIVEISYNDFLDFVEDDKVDTVYYNRNDEYMTVTLFNEDTKKMTIEERKEYNYENTDKRRVLYPAYDDFRKDLLENDINVVLDESNITVLGAINMLVTLAIPCLWIYIIFKMLKSQTKGLDKDNLIQTSDVKFEDVIGQDEVLDDVRFITELLKNHDLGAEIGANVPKGILLSGEPGTGKTLIAKAIAGEAGVPFIYVNSSSLIEMFVGLGAKRVRELFKIARENSPCIVFFDEIDSIGVKRDSRGSTSENEQTINALLQEMDGFSGREGVFIIAATNRPDKLDNALVRAGRFDRRIEINKPRDWKVRVQLFKFYLNKFKVDESVDIETLSKQVSGFTGADIAAICNEASIIAVMHKKHSIDMNCLEEAIDKKIFHGNRAKEDHFKDDKRIVAYHESGHAVMNYLCKLPISRASIIGTTSGVGGVVFGADSDSCFLTNEELEKHVMVAYAGRASEEIKFKTVTTGASNDITQATNIMSSYIQHYGFDKDFGLLDMSVLSEQGLTDMKDITSRLSKMSRDLYDKTISILNDNYNKVEILAQKLLEVETLSGKEIEKLLNSID